MGVFVSNMDFRSMYIYSHVFEFANVFMGALASVRELYGCLRVSYVYFTHVLTSCGSFDHVIHSAQFDERRLNVGRYDSFSFLSVSIITVHIWKRKRHCSKYCTVGGECSLSEKEKTQEVCSAGN